jgi:hypothetical protein
MTKRPGHTWTIVLLKAGGACSHQLQVPGLSYAGAQLLALLFCLLAGVTGWQMQARYAVRGSQVTGLGLLDTTAERWSLFERLPPSRQGPSRDERRLIAAAQRALRLGLGDRRAAELLWAGMVAPEWIEEAKRGGRSDGTLLWPVRQGYFGRGFGSGENGYHLAIDIDGERGADVLAAEPGIVGYVGHELRGYGNMVLLVHPDGHVTLYGHNQRALVVAGERVVQGQAIAELGSTGHSMGPHVHFELIHDGRNCDPLALFRPSAQDAGRVPEVAPAVWQAGAERPGSIRCRRRIPHPRHEEEENVMGASDQTGSDTHSG